MVESDELLLAAVVVELELVALQVRDRRSPLIGGNESDLNRARFGLQCETTAIPAGGRRSRVFGAIWQSIQSLGLHLPIAVRLLRRRGSCRRCTRRLRGRIRTACRPDRGRPWPWPWPRRGRGRGRGAFR